MEVAYETLEPCCFFHKLNDEYDNGNYFWNVRSLSFKHSGLEWDLCIILWPVRWVTAYLLINIVIYPIGFGLAERVFHFNPDRDGMSLWNPAAFFISLMISFLMAVIFGLPMGMPVKFLFYLWPVRWVTAYLLINIVIYPIGFGLAKKVFGFDPMAGNT